MDPTSQIVSSLATAGSEEAAKEAAGFMQRLLGPAFDEFGQAIRDRVILFRARRIVRLMDRTQVLLHKAGRKPQRVAPKTLLAILEGASLEDNDDLSDLWAALLANASIADDLSYGASFSAILRQLTPHDAKVLAALWTVRTQAPDENWEPRGAVNLNAFYGGIENQASESGREQHSPIVESLIKKQPALKALWNTPAEKLVVSVDNLLRLGLLEDRSFSRVEIPDVTQGLGLRVSVFPRQHHFYIPSRERVVFSHLGIAFMQACEPPA